MKRSFIKEMDNGKYIKLDEFINNMSSIWEWMTTKWMRMVDEVKKNNIQLSQVSKFWKCIQESFKKPHQIISLEREIMRVSFNKYSSKVLDVLNKQ